MVCSEAAIRWRDILGFCSLETALNAGIKGKCTDAIESLHVVILCSAVFKFSFANPSMLSLNLLCSASALMSGKETKQNKNKMRLDQLGRKV